MRTLLLLPIAVAAALAGACRTASDGADETASRAPHRDLTLGQTEAAPVLVASPVELAREPVQRRASPAARPRRAAAPRRETAHDGDATTVVAPVPAPASADTAAATSSAADEHASAEQDPYALAPGQTVTVIPASSGPSSEPTWTDQGPPDERRGTTIHSGGRGGDCGGRGSGRHPGGVSGPDLRGLR
jgi:hypothetical protein